MTDAIKIITDHGGPSSEPQKFTFSIESLESGYISGHYVMHSNLKIANTDPAVGIYDVNVIQGKFSARIEIRFFDKIDYLACLEENENTV